MKLRNPVIQISLSLTLVCAVVIAVTNVLGLFPDRRAEIVRGRSALCEALAVNCSLLAAADQFDTIESSLAFLVKRNSEALSAGLRRSDQSLVVQAGNHELPWLDAQEKQLDGCFFVPILTSEGVWGQLEVRFEPIYQGWTRAVDPAFLWFAGFTVPMIGLIIWFQLKRVLKHLDPSRAVPSRVRTALDSLAEGVVVLDEQQRIVLANQAFALTTGANSSELLGHKVDQLPWVRTEGDGPPQLPWLNTAQDHKSHIGVSIALQQNNERRVFKVNSAPILDEAGAYRGALASFGDVTDLEKRKGELICLLDSLRESRDEIRRQNEELLHLASRDPLTSCFNRRTFFEQFDQHWKLARRTKRPLSCLMVDIDFFKLINDNHGHSKGDEVLRAVGGLLRKATREVDVVCRYGGEEFCVLLPGMHLEDATEAAEELLDALRQLTFGQLKITASLGAASMSQGAQSPQELLDFADKCLYVAKRGGRNQVVPYDEASCQDTGLDASQRECPAANSPSTESYEQVIPYHAVRALLSALSYREPGTAAHSARVADLAVLLARQHLSAVETYIVEIAALLHDIGKIGVPDAILLKPGPLTPEEWKVMARHDRIGVEIISSSFRCAQLTEIVRTHHATYGGKAGAPHLPVGEDIPLGARIVTIADSFDAIVSDRPYRKGRSMEEAFAELRRCAGSQFDPALVEQFIELAERYFASESATPAGLPQETALGIGLQVERIATALDAKDLGGVATLVERLKSTAEQSQLSQLSRAAGVVGELAKSEDADLSELVQATHELMDLCRAAHASVIDNVHGPDEPVGSQGPRRESEDPSRVGEPATS